MRTGWNEVSATTTRRSNLPFHIHDAYAHEVLRDLCQHVGLVSGAFATIFVTTADDALWLVPFLTGSRFSLSSRMLHACCFVATLQASVWLSYGITLGFGVAIRAQHTGGTIPPDEIIEMVGAALAWLIALVLAAKKLRKWLRKRRVAEVEQEVPLISVDSDGHGGHYGSTKLPEQQEGTNSVESNCEASLQQLDGLSPESEEVEAAMPFTVITLTTLGALDEVSLGSNYCLNSQYQPSHTYFTE